MDFESLSAEERKRLHVHQNAERFYNALAVSEFLLRQTGGDQTAALKIAQEEDARRAGRDYGFWREVQNILKQ